MSYTRNNYEGYQDWKTYKVTVTIRARSPDDAGKLVSFGFDRSMSFEDKVINKPKVVKVELDETSVC